MAIIRKIFGPFHFEVTTKDRKPVGQWHFNGIRDDYTVAHWLLTFDPSTRKFRANGLVVGQGLGGRIMRKVEQSLPDYGTKCINDKMFLSDDEPVLTGLVVDLLKDRLTPEDIAKATALAIIRQ